MNKIVCPSCFSIFSTVHQPGKRERCPYCGTEVRHTAALIELGRNLQLNENDPQCIAAWVDAKLEILRLWWKSCENPTEQDLDELIDKLWMFEQEIVKLRREQDARQQRT
ncbi:MAG TPA: hypothetical protein GXZ82_03150 [Firmicutes bacterium]|nr:hypothetical protein [Bacillota bacterium]